MDSRFASLRNPILCYNSKREILFAISCTSPTSLFCLLIKTKETLEKPLALDFVPEKLLCGSEDLIIQGTDRFASYNLDSQRLKTIGSLRAKIFSIAFHPLSEKTLGVLTADSNLSLYTLPDQIPEFTYSLYPQDPVSFCFFEDKPNFLFRLGCLILTKSGQLFVLSPVLPRSFVVGHDILQFSNYFAVPGNSYVKQESQIVEFFSILENCIISESRKWNKLCVDHFRALDPVLRGPCFETKTQCAEVHVLLSAGPCVVVLVTAKGNLIFAVAAGDLVPSFSAGNPSVEWQFYEELPFRKKGLLVCDEILLYACEDKLFRIDTPWINELKNCYVRRIPPKNLMETSVNLIKESLEINGICLVKKGINKTVFICRSLGFIEENLNFSSKSEPILSIDQKYLECELKTLPEFSSLSSDGLRKVNVELSEFQGEENELLNLLKVFDEQIEKNGKPIADKVEAIKERMVECVKRNEILSKSYENIAKNIEHMEKYCEQISKKITIIEKNDQSIRERIQDIIDIQQDVKRPLTQKEQELSNKLNRLENLTKSLKNHASEKLKEFFAEQESLKRLSGPNILDNESKSELNLLLYQLQEISTEVNKYKSN